MGTGLKYFIIPLIFNTFVFPTLLLANTTQQQFRAAQAEQFQKAADSAEEAAKTHDILWKVWAGVGVICTATCATSLGGATIIGAGTDPWICPGAVIAGSVTDAAMTKEFTTALMGIAGAGVSIAMMPEAPVETAKVAGDVAKGVVGGAAGGAAKQGVAAPQPKVAKNWGACLNAAMSMVQVFMKRQAMADEKKVAKENRKRADELLNAKDAAAIAAAPPVSIPQQSTATAGGSSASGLSGAGSSRGPSEKSAEGPTLANSNVCKNTENVSTAIQCAVANDSNLPEFVKNPNFNKNFKRASGIDFGKFLSQDSGSTSQAFQGALGGTFNKAKGAEFTALIDRYERKFQMMGPVEGSSYAGGGGGGTRSSDNSEEINPQAIIEGLMGQLLPKEETTQPNHFDAIEKANRTRSPASVTDDPKISLFERISYRYQHVVRRNLSR